MANALLDELRNLNYSNQLDSDEHRWAPLCNLLGDLLDNVDTVEDLPAHERLVAKEGFKSDAEVYCHMADRLAEHAEKLMRFSQQLRALTAMPLINE